MHVIEAFFGLSAADIRRLPFFLLQIAPFMLLLVIYLIFVGISGRRR
ncbi:MAG: hypothetical protein ACRETK_13815 [Steroidobacteraceae bacterium]